MPFRARMKRAFGHSPSASSSSSNVSSTKPRLDHRTDPTVYKPGEAMPTAKYRQPAEKGHKAHLESFSFGSATAKLARRLSDMSSYSPMGTRLPSRNHSIQGGSQLASRNGSLSGAATGRFGGSEVAKVAESQDEVGDITNVGITAGRREEKADVDISKPDMLGIDTQLANDDSKKPEIETAHDHTPFTEDDVTNALKKGSSKA